MFGVNGHIWREREKERSFTIAIMQKTSYNVICTGVA
jgi:hypothetical protein